jgi:transposase
MACDGRGLPLSVWVTAGNVNDCTELEAVLAGIHVPRLGPGRPRTRPEAVIADKGYSSRANRRVLAARGIKAVIPERADQLANRRRRGAKGGRPYALDRTLYRRRNTVERGFNLYKNWRGLASRYDKTAVNYLGGLVLASALMWAGA